MRRAAHQLHHLGIGVSLFQAGSRERTSQRAAWLASAAVLTYFAHRYHHAEAR
jgi:hypothetical protein